ncbi:helix-turn-helix transcriptional regulator [Pseudobacteriovorax antillogorgiicola]|uniref:Regulatory protein, luxR family n=1 Tax=Pseudobacteriovorax antillogorgiicola TaxID=1513793 RepID=A0A1Y6CVR0_9BACT|nr:LuxR C-terminal-related transcriptional regulator [Pseudobacteriovorax antillogorgiicola]TCS44240.1 regulatory LuxR family protein [Pseudobacteriovorax antillogorgiicola]SMF80681.1 regulatory protein, luxR family [Pseudobacteriovorax antillogorgiicola]
MDLKYHDEVAVFSTKYSLTRREKDVLLHLVNGVCSGEEVSESLGLSPNTVRIHFKNLFLKLDVNSKPEVLVKFLHFVVR